MNQLQRVFDYQGSKIRTVIRDGEPWWVAADICFIIGITNPSMATARLDEDEVTLSQIEGSHRPTNVVNESGLYKLILRSEKPEAKKFTKWVTSEVLPAIRKIGSYEIAPQPALPKTYAEALRMLADTVELNERQAKVLAEAQPKIEAFDTFLGAKNSMAMNEVAKALSTGRNRLFAFLRDRNILMSSNLPFQRFVDDGIFTVREVTIKHSDYTETKAQTLVTPKGVEFIRKVLAVKDLD